MTKSDIQSFLTLPTYHGLAPEDAKAIAENVLEIVK